MSEQWIKYMLELEARDIGVIFKGLAGIPSCDRANDASTDPLQVAAEAGIDANSSEDGSPRSPGANPERSPDPNPLGVREPHRSPKS